MANTTANFELTGETRHAYSGDALHRIRAIRDIPSQNVKAGDLGGWVGEHATVTGNAWIADGAQVSGHAVIEDEARVEKGAQVKGSARVSKNALVTGGAFVTGHSIVTDNARISGEASVCDEVVVCDRATMTDFSQAYGKVVVGGTTAVMASSVLDGEFHYIGDEVIADDEEDEEM